MARNIGVEMMNLVTYPFRNIIELSVFTLLRMIFIFTPLFIAFLFEEVIFIIIAMIIGLFIALLLNYMLSIYYAKSMVKRELSDHSKNEIIEKLLRRTPGYSSSVKTFGFDHFKNKYMKVVSLDDINIASRKVFYFSIIYPSTYKKRLSFVFIEDKQLNRLESLLNSDFDKYSLVVLVFKDSDCMKKLDLSLICDENRNRIVAMLYFEGTVVKKVFNLVALNSYKNIDSVHKMIYKKYMKDNRQAVLIDYSRRVFSEIHKYFQ